MIPRVDECVVKPTRCEALVLTEYLGRRGGTDDLTSLDDGEATALLRLSRALGNADDGALFAPDYREQVGAARQRIRATG
jgi:hypothetical protein